LLEEKSLERVGSLLSQAKQIFTSDLTLLECDRVLIRAAALELAAGPALSQKREVLTRAAGHWIIVVVGQEVIARARRAFPVEPVRALDALHLATALSVRDRAYGLSVLSRDRRIRENAAALGIDVVPKE
jgi:predicted nucleic acid-binding protein